MTQIMKQNLDAAGNIIYPAWLVEITPGAAEAYEAVLKAQEEAAVKNRRIAELIRLKNEMTYWASPGDRQRKPSVRQEDLDKVLVELADLQRGGGSRGPNARKAYDDLMQGRSGALDPAARRRAAASFAVARQEEAERLKADLLRVLTERDEAFVAAGKPGFHWSRRGGEGPNLTISQVERGLSLWVDGFDTAAAGKAADGEKVMTEAEIDAADQEEADRINRRTAAASRSRRGI